MKYITRTVFRNGREGTLTHNKYKEEKNLKKNNRGFTLAELLIVVAIIAVLVAIAIPVFTSQLEKSREATDMSNIRSAYAEAMAEYLANGADKSYYSVVALKQQQDKWQNTENGKLYTRVNGEEKEVPVDDSIVGKGKTVYVNVATDGTVTVTASALSGATKIGTAAADDGD